MFWSRRRDEAFASEIPGRRWGRWTIASGAGSPDKFSEGNRTPPLYSAGIASHKNTIPFITWKRPWKLLKKLDIRRYELVIAIWCQLVRNQEERCLILTNLTLVRKRASTFLVGGNKDGVIWGPTVSIPSLEDAIHSPSTLTANCMAYAQVLMSHNLLPH